MRSVVVIAGSERRRVQRQRAGRVHPDRSGRRGLWRQAHFTGLGQGLLAAEAQPFRDVMGQGARTLGQGGSELAGQSRLTRELQDDLLRTRLVEFDSLAERIDKEKELTEILKQKREAATADGDAVAKANEQYQATLKRLIDATPTAQLEKSRADIILLTEEFQKFVDTAGKAGINEQTYLEAVSARLDITAAKLEKSKSIAEAAKAIAALAAAARSDEPPSSRSS